jgi:hypothetical protein
VGASAGLAGILIAPWFLYAQAVHGMRLWRTMLGAHVCQRFTASLDPVHVREWHYYLTELYA